MPRLVQEAKRDHADLDRIPPSKEYKTHLQKRIRRKKLDGDAVLNWMDDAGEWWKARRHDFPAHALALRLWLLYNSQAVQSKEFSQS